MSNENYSATTDILCQLLKAIRLSKEYSQAKIEELASVDVSKYEMRN